MTRHKDDEADSTQRKRMVAMREYEAVKRVGLW